MPKEIKAPPVVTPELHSIDKQLKQLYVTQYYHRKWSPELDAQRSMLVRQRTALLTNS